MNDKNQYYEEDSMYLNTLKKRFFEMYAKEKIGETNKLSNELDSLQAQIKEVTEEMEKYYGHA